MNNYLPNPSWITDPDMVDNIITGSIAILSALLTLVITHLLRNSGRILVFVRTIDDDFVKPDHVGGQKHVTAITESESASILFEIDFWNSSDVPKSVRDLRIEIMSMEKKVNLPLYVRIIPSSSSGAYPLGSIFHKEYSFINLASKQISPLQFFIKIPKEQYPMFKGTVNFWLVGKRPKNFRFKRLLATREY